MIDDATIQAAGTLLPMAIAGLGLGQLYFVAVRRTAALCGSSGDWRLPLVLTAGRLLAIAAAFAVAAQFGAGALLAVFLGFLAARHLALRAARREAV